MKLKPFDELIVLLRQRGFAAEADELEGVRLAVWTTSSEFAGELGQVVSKLRRDDSRWDVVIREAIDGCLKEVRTVWPGWD